MYISRKTFILIGLLLNVNHDVYDMDLQLVFSIITLP